MFLTRDRGKKRGVAKGARRQKSNFVGALEPLTQARVAYFEKEQRELVNLNYSEPARSALSSGTIEALGCAAYFAELIDEWAAESHEDERLYRLGASMVDALASGVPPEPLSRYFEYWLLSLQGVYPATGRAAQQAVERRAEVPQPGARAGRRRWWGWRWTARRCASSKRCIAASSPCIWSASPDRLKC